MTIEPPDNRSGSYNNYYPVVQRFGVPLINSGDSELDQSTDVIG